jgi:hypothetical protein
VPRAEIPDLVTGRFEHVHNVRVPGMLHGRVVRPPEAGAEARERERGIGQGRGGTREGRGQERLRGVVAEKPWQAIRPPRS